MPDRREVVAVYGAGLAQGVALVTFPAASSILTSPQYYGLSDSAYGGLFLPQALAAIASALGGSRLSPSVGAKRLFLVGLVADLVAMLLLFGSQLFIGDGSVPYLILLGGTTSLGIGFGLTVPALNLFAASFFPERADRAVLYLNALLGLGTALAPVLVAVFLGLGAWWGLPLAVAAVLAVLLVSSAALPLRTPSSDGAGAGARPGWPRRFWVFAAFALLYGVVETMNGNWATLFMTRDIGASTAIASVALTTFWAMVTVGRVVFAAVERRFPASNTYRLLPFVAAIAVAIISLLPSGAELQAVLAFGLAGLGCSALLPLTISFGQRELATIGATVAGGLIAFYQMGYGLAAFGVGALQDVSGVGLPGLYGATAVVALALAGLAFVVIERAPASTNGPAPGSAV